MDQLIGIVIHECLRMPNWLSFPGLGLFLGLAYIGHLRAVRAIDTRFPLKPMYVGMVRPPPSVNEFLKTVDLALLSFMIFAILALTLIHVTAGDNMAVVWLVAGTMIAIVVASIFRGANNERQT